jgi:hypothetical protein
MEAFSQNDHPTPVAEAISQSDPNLSGFKPLDIYPTEFLFGKDKLPDGRPLTPVATALSLNTSRPRTKTTNQLT